MSMGPEHKRKVKELLNTFDVDEIKSLIGEDQSIRHVFFFFNDIAVLQHVNIGRCMCSGHVPGPISEIWGRLSNKYELQHIMFPS